jgi:hypothetical protein
MASLFFPQLATGALAQYPIHKTRIQRSVTNLLADGTLIMTPDPDATLLRWQLSYSGLSGEEIQALQMLFQACAGPLRAFTFIDPTDNMLAWSGDFTMPVWQRSNLVTVTPGAADPSGGYGATVVTNTSEAALQIAQTLNVPANYYYCFSLYVASAQPAPVGLIRQGATNGALDDFSTAPTWTRLISSGNLDDSGTILTVGINLEPGQQIAVFGPQLEPQVSPSSFRMTTENGGVYADAHWVQNELPVAATAPNIFSTTFLIETVL